MVLDPADPPTFPPRLRGEEAAAGDPFGRAVARAREGADPGLVLWSCPPEALRAAVVLAPEEPLGRAIGIFLAAPLALGDALASLAPPEVAIHYRWPGGVLVNGASCGRACAAAATTDPVAVPDWLVLGVEMPFLPPPGREGGERPGETFLHAEGCGEVTPPALLESWSRHLLLWISRFVDDGLTPLHAAWSAQAERIGASRPDDTGTFIGLDEHGGMLVNRRGGTELRPLTEALEP